MGYFKYSALSAIREDYIEKGEESFLYRHIVNTKNDEIDKMLRKPGNKGRDRKWAVHKLARDLMYNLGCPLSGNRPVSGKARSNNTALDMIDKWCDMNSIAGKADNTYRQVSSFDGDFDPKPYQELFDELNRNNCTGAFVPVRIDPQTGAGFAIVGRDHFLKFPADAPGKSRACGIAIFCQWTSGHTVGGIRGKNFRDMNLSFEYDEKECPDLKPTISEADSWFRALITENRSELFDSIILCNRDYTGKLRNIPETLKQYFYEADDDFDLITDDDLNEAKAEYARG